MAKLSGEFTLDLPPHDALVACVDALDGLGWEVQSVKPRKVVAAAHSGHWTERSTIEVGLREPGVDATVVRLTASTRGISAKHLENEMNQARGAIEAAARWDAHLAPSASSERGERSADLDQPVLEPELREHLQRATASDRTWARAFRVLALALIVASVIVLAEAAVTLLWREPLSYVYARGQQSELEDRLGDIEFRYRRADRRRAQTLAPGPPTLREAAARFSRSTGIEEPLGRISADAIGLDSVFVQGAGEASLRKGPGHYSPTPLPGQPGTVGIAGHRTTYSAPFRDLDDLERGDRVVITMPYGVFTYRVQGSDVVSPQDVQVLGQVRHNRLTMTAYHPMYSDSERIAVFARLADQRRRYPEPRPGA